MKTILKLFILTLVLNVIRYLIGMPIESWLIMEPMHAMMPDYPSVFDLSFTRKDIIISLFYNFVLWFAAVLIFHFSHKNFQGHMILRSFKGFGLGLLLFISLAAVYMNHYTADIKTFYLYSMIDAVILFFLLAFFNGILYPRFFDESKS